MFIYVLCTQISTNKKNEIFSQKSGMSNGSSKTSEKKGREISF